MIPSLPFNILKKVPADITIMYMILGSSYDAYGMTHVYGTKIITNLST